MSNSRSFLDDQAKDALIALLERALPKKPIFVDTRFRYHGRSVADGCSLSKCFKCPGCGSHIFHVFDSEDFCVHCGQALDWSVLNTSGEEVPK